MPFQPDRRFESLTEAFGYISGQYALQPVDRVWDQSASGLVYPRALPRYLFRGECGDFETTRDSASRLDGEVLACGCRLSAMDLDRLRDLIGWLVGRLCTGPYRLDRILAIALLQHYGLPTRIVDLTARLDCAFAFAATEPSSTGRVAVMPRDAPSQTVRVVDFRVGTRLSASSMTARVQDLMAHPWAERAQRQAAYGIVMSPDLADLKSAAERSRLGIKWYEFPVSPSDCAHLRTRHQELTGQLDDPSAGFLRFHITEYVEAVGKFSPTLTDWLLSRIPIAPYCYLVQAFEGNEVVVYYRGSDAVPGFNKGAEAEHSRRYWSSAHAADHSSERMKAFVKPAPGSIVADPRTYHRQV